MVVPGQAPGSGDGFHPVGPVVPITVNHSANLLAVGVVEGSILPVHPQRFMQTFKVGRPANLGQIISISTLTDPDLSPARAHSNPLVGKQSDRTRLKDHILGHGDFLAEVVP